MGLKLKLIGIGLLFAAALLRADDDASLDAPSHLTLTVNSAKDGTISWDPIDREDLEGYSIWMRKGPGDFTRLDIPTTVHGQELKEPMISKSFLVLKGLGKRQLELAVVAEYEGGRSPKSASVFSRLARFVPLSGTAAMPEGPEAGSEESLSATSATAAAVAPEATPSETPESEALISNGTPSYKHLRSVMAPQGTFHSSVRGDFIWEQINSSGDASLNQLGRYIVGGDPVPADQVESYSSAYVTRIIREALSMEYGLLPNMELGIEEDYSDEREYVQNFYFDGVNYESENSEAAQEGSAFMNPIVKVRIQPLASQPLRLTLWGDFATGSRSRLQAWGDYSEGIQKVAGVDDDATRLKIILDYGDEGVNSGLFYHLSYEPGATESATLYDPTGNYPMSLSHGQEIEAGIGYTAPWWQDSMPGALAGGFLVRNVQAGVWDVDGFNEEPEMSNDELAYFRAFTGTPLEAETQLEVFVDVTQNIYQGYGPRDAVKGSIDAGGRFSATILPNNSWIFDVSGGFYY